jgi:hypothetical protein
MGSTGSSRTRKYDIKQVEIGKKLISKPRSWQAKVKEHDKRPNARELRRGRLRRKRQRRPLNKDRRTEGEHQDGSRCQ